jgi:hypothetical protein
VPCLSRICAVPKATPANEQAAASVLILGTLGTSTKSKARVSIGNSFCCARFALFTSWLRSAAACRRHPYKTAAALARTAHATLPPRHKNLPVFSAPNGGLPLCLLLTPKSVPVTARRSSVNSIEHSDRSKDGEYWGRGRCSGTGCLPCGGTLLRSGLVNRAPCGARPRSRAGGSACAGESTRVAGPSRRRGRAALRRPATKRGPLPP